MKTLSWRIERKELGRWGIWVNSRGKGSDPSQPWQCQSTRKDAEKAFTIFTNFFFIIRDIFATVQWFIFLDCSERRENIKNSEWLLVLGNLTILEYRHFQGKIKQNKRVISIDNTIYCVLLFLMPFYSWFSFLIDLSSFPLALISPDINSGSKIIIDMFFFT